MSADAREVVSEREVREELARLEAYRDQLQLLLQQHQLLVVSRSEHDRARATLEALDGLGADREFVLPLGADAYVRGRAAREAPVLLGIGSGIVVEIDRPKAIETLAERLGRLDRASQELDGQVRGLEERIQFISQRLESLAPAEGDAPGAPSSDVGRA